MLKSVGSEENVSHAVRSVIAAVMRERGLDTARIAHDARLSDTLGLKSMDLAQIVLMLEDDLDADPFQQIPITSIRTVGDLIRAYTVTLGLTCGVAPGGQDMAAEMEAARARRAGRRR